MQGSNLAIITYNNLNLFSLLENYGMRKLKEQFMYQVAGQILLEQTLQYINQETAQWDESNRIEAPVRIVHV